MLTEQIIEFKLSGPEPLGRYMYSYNWLFSWQNKISYGKSSNGLLSTAKILQKGQFMLLPRTWTNHIQSKPICKILNLFWTKIVSKKTIELFNFSIGFLIVKNLVFSNYSKNAQNVIQWH